MKKFLFFINLFLLSTNAFSQLRVANNGNSMFGLSSSETPLSTICVGNIGRTDSKLTVLGDDIGIFAYRNGVTIPNWGNAIHVTTTKQYGNVTIKNGGSLTLKANYETLLKDGFECENGAELIIK